MELEAANAIGAGIACIGMGAAGIGVGSIFGNYLAADAADAVVERLVGLKASAAELSDAVTAARSGGAGNA